MSKELYRDEMPMVTCKLIPTIISNLLNDWTFIKYLDLPEIVKDENILLCECENPKFKVSDHNYILTEDLL